MNDLVETKSFVEAVRRGIEAFEEAGRILVEMIDRDPGCLAQLKEQNPEFTNEILRTFERIGRRQLYYKLCLKETPGAKALLRCAYSEQVKYCNEPIPFLLLQAKDQTDHLLVQLDALSPAQVRQVFCNGRIRDLGAQRAYLEGRKQRLPEVTEVEQVYRVTKGKVTFLKPCMLSAGDLARIIAEISR
jgi:hypothetical protein